MSSECNMSKSECEERLQLICNREYMCREKKDWSQREEEGFKRGEDIGIISGFAQGWEGGVRYGKSVGEIHAHKKELILTVGALVFCRLIVATQGS